jgi:hypothetical protein
MHEDVVAGDTTFIADHSFLFYVVDPTNQLILLMGSITSPFAVDLTPNPADQAESNFITQITNDQVVYVTETVTENTDLWAQIEKMDTKIGEMTRPTPVEETVEIPENSDLMDFLNEGRKLRPPTQEELDAFFGLQTPEKVTYPRYSCWREVEFMPPQSQVAYDPITETHSHPSTAMSESIKGRFEETETRKAQSAQTKPLPRIVRPKLQNVANLKAYLRPRRF